MAHRPDRCIARGIAVVALALLLAPAVQGTPASPPSGAQEGFNWIEYSIEGDATVELKEKDLVMCSKVEDEMEFQMRSLGEWKIGAESPSAAFGEHEARFELSPPLGEYRDDDARTDDRAWGDGTLVLEDGGRDPMGFAVFKGSFEIAVLEAQSGFSFTLRGTFACQIL